MEPTHPTRQVQQPESDPFIGRGLTVLGAAVAVLVILFLIWNTLGLLTLIFASILLAVFLRSLSDLLSKYSRLPSRLSLMIVVMLILGALSLGIWLLSAPLTVQFRQLERALPKSLQILQGTLVQFEWGRQLLDQILVFDDWLVDRFFLLDQVAGIFSTTVGVLVSFVLVVFVGLYLSIQPELYVNGFLKLVPINRRERFHQVLRTSKQTLQWWLLGRGLSMLAVGILVSLGLWILGIPLALALGILAALLDFIPNIGPVLATAPAVLIALTQSPAKALAVLILYLTIQQIESYLITPIIQQKTVALPPALTLIAQVLLTLLLGGIGLVIASPLIAVIIVMVRMLYVEDILGDAPTGKPNLNHAPAATASEKKGEADPSL